LRKHLRDSLERESTTEIDRMLRGITGAFEPYQRFYAAESAKIEEFATKLTAIDAEAREIHAKVEKLK
jgi:hypothetical protein